jgi:hypothetical protein
MKIKHILFVPFFILAACANDNSDVVGSDGTSSWLDSTLNLDESQNIHQNKNAEMVEKFQNAMPDSLLTPSSIITTPVDNNGRRYNGAWFSIDKPSGFTKTNITSTEVIDDYTYENADEANFISADGSVEFFVYSPQWGGEPTNYLEKWAGETIEVNKTEAEEVMPSNVHRWITFNGVDGSYTRSVYSQKSESTHLVFGIKFKDATSYELYQKEYELFKKSLEQYAD